MGETISDLIQHLETYLGEISSGYPHDDNGAKLPFQIVRFENAPPNTTTLVTLGLSKVGLRAGETTKRIRQEFLMTMNAEWNPKNLPAVLHQIATEAYAKDEAYLRGQFIGPRGHLVEGTAMEALYVSIPIYFPDDFHVYTPPTGDPIVLVWVIPITAAEAHYVNEHTWEAFEDLLEKTNPDLRDLGRASVV
ncbi:MAG: hypothetical protein JWO86_1920 [Myxococcaceae bacterium]|nr:hypothetical protein [Myxococcaceae bacterium]